MQRIDDAERGEIESARAESAGKGGVAFEAFFAVVLGSQN